MSGKVILMVAAIPSSNSNAIDHLLWGDDVHCNVSTCKHNALKSYSHHDSKGYVYSFGNKALYGRNNNSLLGTYSNRKSKNSYKQVIIDKGATDVEELCSYSIHHGINVLSNIVPELKHLLSPIIRSADIITAGNTGDDILLKKGNTSSDGCWNAILNVDGRTENLHTEKYCMYTFTTVPKQVVNTSIPLMHKPFFIFKINERTQIMLPLTEFTSFVYSAKLLTHRQAYTPYQNKGTPKFYNISSYGNEKLFNHLRKSIERIHKSL